VVKKKTRKITGSTSKSANSEPKSSSGSSKTQKTATKTSAKRKEEFFGAKTDRNLTSGGGGNAGSYEEL